MADSSGAAAAEAVAVAAAECQRRLTPTREQQTTSQLHQQADPSQEATLVEKSEAKTMSEQTKTSAKQKISNGNSNQDETVSRPTTSGQESEPERRQATPVGLEGDRSGHRTHQWHHGNSGPQTHTFGEQVRQHVAQASDQLGHSLRQLYASASSMGANAEAPPQPPPLYQHLPGVVPYFQGRHIGPPPSYDDVINPFAPPPTYQSLFGQMREARKSSRSLLDLARRLLIILASTLGCTILIAFIILIPFAMIIVGAVFIDQCNIEHIPTFLLVGGLVWATKNVLHCYSQCRKQSAAEQSAALVVEELYRRGNDNGSPSASFASTDSSPTSNNGHQQQQHWPLPQNATPVGLLVDGLPVDWTDGTRTSRHPTTHRQTSAHSQQTPTRNHWPATQQNHQHHFGPTTNRLKSSICESLLSCVLFGWFIAGCVIVFRNNEPDFNNTSSVRYCHKTVYMFTFWLVASALLSFGLFITFICCLLVSTMVAKRQDDTDLA